MARPCALSAVGLITALGASADETWSRLLAADPTHVDAFGLHEPRPGRLRSRLIDPFID